jgi:hypothetical protein
MKTFLVQIVQEFEIEVEATDEAMALALARKQYNDLANETVTVDELAD